MVTIIMATVIPLIMLQSQIITLPMELKIQRVKYHKAEKKPDMVMLFMVNTGRYYSEFCYILYHIVNNNECNNISVVDPDGVLRTVKYTADKKNGFQAEVITNGKSNGGGGNGGDGGHEESGHLESHDDDDQSEEYY